MNWISLSILKKLRLRNRQHKGEKNHYFSRIIIMTIVMHSAVIFNKKGSTNFNHFQFILEASNVVSNCSRTICPFQQFPCEVHVCFYGNGSKLLSCKWTELFASKFPSVYNMYKWRLTVLNTAITDNRTHTGWSYAYLFRNKSEQSSENQNEVLN